MRVQQCLNTAPFGAVHRGEIGQPMVGSHAVAMVQPHPIGHGYPGVLQLLGIPGELQQGTGTNLRGEFRIHDGVARLPIAFTFATGDLDEKVRAAIEAAVEEGRLKHDVRTRLQRSERLFAVRNERGAKLPADLASDDRDSAARFGIERPELAQVGRQHSLLVRVPEAGGALAHRILRHVQRWRPPEFGIQFPQEQERTGRLRDVGGRVDHGRCAVGLEDEHPATVGLPSDNTA